MSTDTTPPKIALIKMQASRPVIAFALLRQCSEYMQTDLLGGIAILIRPLVNDLANKVFDSKILSERLGLSYGISIPAAALEGMTHRLISAGILRTEKTEVGIPRALYCANIEENELKPETESAFQEIIDEYLQHAAAKLTSAGKHLEESVLTTGFLRHLATLDFSAIRAKPMLTPDSSKKIIGPTAREQQELSTELAERAIVDSLVASYITWLQEHHPVRLDLLTKVADGALAAELVFDLQAPTAVSRLTNTIIVVDTSLILSYLDLSSIQEKIETRSLFEKIQETGAKIAAFQHSIDEAEGVIKAIQNARNAGDAYGPSVHRLSNSAFRAYFDSMNGAIKKSWSQVHNFEVLQETSTHFHKNFTQI